MYPVLSIGALKVSTYHLCLVIAFGGGTWLALALNRRRLNRLNVDAMVVIPATISTLVGARLVWLIGQGSLFPVWEPFLIWKAGFCIHGGILGFVLGYVVYLRRGKNSVGDGLDLAAPCLAFGEAINRIGCFFGGCCWGTPTAGFLGVVYPRHSHAFIDHVQKGLISPTAAYSARVHPHPIYLAVALLLLCLFLMKLHSWPAFSGEVFLSYLIGHSFIRFFMEFFRDDLDKTSVGLSVTQLLSLFVFCGGLGVLLTAYFRLGRNRLKEAL